MAPSFGTSGLRSHVLELTCAVVKSYVTAVIQECASITKLCIGRDLRALVLRIPLKDLRILDLRPLANTAGFRTHARAARAKAAHKRLSSAVTKTRAFLADVRISS